MSKHEIIYNIYNLLDEITLRNNTINTKIGEIENQKKEIEKLNDNIKTINNNLATAIAVRDYFLFCVEIIILFCAY